MLVCKKRWKAKMNIIKFHISVNKYPKMTPKTPEKFTENNKNLWITYHPFVFVFFSFSLLYQCPWKIRKLPPNQQNSAENIICLNSSTLTAHCLGIHAAKAVPCSTAKIVGKTVLKHLNLNGFYPSQGYTAQKWTSFPPDKISFRENYVLSLLGWMCLSTKNNFSLQAGRLLPEYQKIWHWLNFKTFNNIFPKTSWLRWAPQIELSMH